MSLRLRTFQAALERWILAVAKPSQSHEYRKVEEVILDYGHVPDLSDERERRDKRGNKKKKEVRIIWNYSRVLFFSSNHNP